MRNCRYLIIKIKNRSENRVWNAIIIPYCTSPIHTKAHLTGLFDRVL